MNNKYSKTKRFFLYYLPILLWCSAIYYLSSVPSLRSDFSDNTDLILRKIAHITEFAVLNYLIFRAIFFDLNNKKALKYSLLFSLFFALTDEYHQSFVYGRNGNFFDFMIDSIGVFVSSCLIMKKYLKIKF